MQASIRNIHTSKIAGDFWKIFASVKAPLPVKYFNKEDPVMCESVEELARMMETSQVGSDSYLAAKAQLIRLEEMTEDLLVEYKEQF